jgi:hypothetical protein
MRLVPAGGGTFRRPGDVGTIAQFTARDDGTAVLVNAATYGERRSLWRVALPPVLLLAALAMAMTAVAAAIVWVPRWLASAAYRGTGGFRERALASLTSASLCALVLLFPGTAGSLELATAGFKNVSYFVDSLTFATLTCASVTMMVLGIRRRRPMKRWARVWVLAANVANAALLALFSVWGIIGWRTWRD